MNILAILKKYNWVYFGDCMCGGSHFNKYSNDNQPGYEVWIGDQIGSFRVYNDAKEPLCEDRSLTRLEATLSLNGLY